MVVVRDWTRAWWNFQRSKYEIVSSDAVREELEQGDQTNQKAKIALLQETRTLPLVPGVWEIVAVYLAHKLMPREVTGDALHLALASFHKCDYLLTWNCQHLANANKFGHIRRINALVNLPTPELVTPLELTEEQL